MEQGAWSLEEVTIRSVACTSRSMLVAPCEHLQAVFLIHTTLVVEVSPVDATLYPTSDVVPGVVLVEFDGIVDP